MDESRTEAGVARALIHAQTHSNLKLDLQDQGLPVVSFALNYGRCSDP